MITISNKFKFTVRAIALVLVICICLSVIMAPKAYAISELVIVGAIALTLSAVAAVVILAAEPLGLKEPIMAAAQHGFQSPREFTANLLDRFGASQGIQRFVMLDKFQKGVMITITGKVILDKVISDFLTEFFSWAWSTDGGALSSFATAGLTTYDPSKIQNPIFDLSNFGILSSYSVSSFQRVNSLENWTANGDAVILETSTQYSAFFAKTDSFESERIYTASNGTQSPQNLTSYKLSYSGFTCQAITYFTISKSLFPFSGETISVSNLDNATLAKVAYILCEGIGTSNESYDENGLVLPAPTTSNVLDVPGALKLPAPIYGTTTATQYLEAAADAITAGSGSLEYEDANGYTQTGTLEGTGEIGLTQVGTQSAELEGAIDIADSVGSETLDNYTIDLKDFFPFCIPFDLRDMLHLLESAPAPVSVEWQFDFGDLGEYEMEINLEEWNAVAQTLRTMELLAFCFGLAMLTKRILMGS